MAKALASTVRAAILRSALGFVTAPAKTGAQSSALHHPRAQGGTPRRCPRRNAQRNAGNCRAPARALAAFASADQEARSLPRRALRQHPRTCSARDEQRARLRRWIGRRGRTAPPGVAAAACGPPRELRAARGIRGGLTRVVAAARLSRRNPFRRAVATAAARARLCQRRLARCGRLPAHGRKHLACRQHDCQQPSHRRVGHRSPRHQRHLSPVGPACSVRASTSSTRADIGTDSTIHLCFQTICRFHEHQPASQDTIDHNRRPARGWGGWHVWTDADCARVVGRGSW